MDEEKALKKVKDSFGDPRPSTIKEKVPLHESTKNFDTLDDIIDALSDYKFVHLDAPSTSKDNKGDKPESKEMLNKSAEEDKENDFITLGAKSGEVEAGVLDHNVVPKKRKKKQKYKYYSVIPDLVTLDYETGDSDSDFEGRILNVDEKKNDELNRRSLLDDKRD